MKKENKKRITISMSEKIWLKYKVFCAKLNESASSRIESMIAEDMIKNSGGRK
jgi:hypothetical protein